MTEEDKKDLKALKEFILDIEKADELEKHTSKINFFNITGIAHFEIRHSRFLSWLLSPNENHNI